MSVEFEWDPLKNIENIRKHGIDFESAQQVFVDPRRQLFLDDMHSTPEEQRYYCIGKVDSQIATVRFTLRENRVRLIGAGYWRKGRKLYEMG